LPAPAGHFLTAGTFRYVPLLDDGRAFFLAGRLLGALVVRLVLRLLRDCATRTVPNQSVTTPHHTNAAAVEITMARLMGRNYVVIP
jgi:hypothetical protein